MLSTLVSLRIRRRRLAFRIFTARVQYTHALANKARYARPPPMSGMYMAALRPVNFWRSVVEHLECRMQMVEAEMRMSARQRVISHHV